MFMKKIIIIALYNLVIVILLCIIFEMLIRLFIPEIKYGGGTSKELLIPSMYSSSPGLAANYRGESNRIIKSTNAYHSWLYNKKLNSNKKKILFLGDSVTMGIGIENDSTFAGRLSNYFKIINPSLIGYSSIDYLNVFNAFVVENRFDLNFDAVIIFWTLNDIYSNYPTQDPPSFQSDDFLYPIINFLRRNSKAYIFLKDIFSDRSKAYFEYDRRYYSLNDTLLQSPVQNINGISSKCKQLNIPFYLFIFPYEYQLRQTNDSTILNPQKILTNLLTQSEIEVIDCIAAFPSGNGNVKDYYLYGDGIHFSEKGHQLIASFIGKKLQTSLE